MVKPYDFGERITEMQNAIKSGAFQPEAHDETAEDDEKGEPDEEQPKRSLVDRILHR
jgi:hypothetical protein